MKKVRKNDLENLVAKLYREFIELKTLDNVVHELCGVNIYVDSVCIYVTDTNDFEDKGEREAYMHNFAEQIEAITFGNLKVTFSECIIDEYTQKCYSYMYIANAYEVVE